MSVKSIKMFGKVVTYKNVGDCWIPAQKRRTSGGRVSYNVKGKMIDAHRMSCEHHHGPAPKGKGLVLHDDTACSDGACINPNHLRWGDRSENASTVDCRPEGRKLTPDLVVSIYLLAWAGERRQRILDMLREEHGITIPITHISMIKSGSRWSRVTGQKFKPQPRCA